MDIYTYTRSNIEKAGFDPGVLECLAADLVKSRSVTEALGAYSKFESEAEKLPWRWDRDFGALVLHKRAHEASVEVAKFMLSKAVDRARWCATCATSGGEGLARVSHVKELEDDFSKYP